MKALVVTPGKSGSLRILETRPPRPGRGELLLKVIRAGVCGTDRDIVAGAYGEAPRGSPYLVIGHESLSRVEDVGAGASGFKKGELVVPTVRRACPQNCLNCRSGESDMCLTGDYVEHGIKGLHGFAREVAVSDHNYVVKVPESLGSEGVLLEPLTIVEKGIFQSYRVQKSRMIWRPKKALVLGAGPVGLLATALLRLRGMDVSTVATRSEESLKARLVEETGATYVNAKRTPLSSLPHHWDLILEATGSTPIALQAEALAGVNGVVCYLGIYRSDVESSNFGISFTNLVLGNRLFLGSVNANKSYFEMGTRDLVRMQRRWSGILRKMITRQVAVEDYAEAYRPGDEEEIKTVVQFS